MVNEQLKVLRTRLDKYPILTNAEVGHSLFRHGKDSRVSRHDKELLCLDRIDRQGMDYPVFSFTLDSTRMTIPMPYSIVRGSLLRFGQRSPLFRRLTVRD